MGVIKAVCTSDIKGIQKTEQAVIELRATPTLRRGTAR